MQGSGLLWVVKCVTRRYDIETGKSNAEILTPRGQDLASTFKKLHLPLSRCPISKQRQRVLAEILNRSSDKAENRNSEEFTQAMRGVNLVDIKLENASGSN